MGTLLRKEFREQWRTYRLLIVVVVLAFFGWSSPPIARYVPLLLQSIPGVPPEVGLLIPTPTVADAVGQYVKNVGQFGILLALLVPMGAVALEKERGTAAMLLSKPVSRGAFLLAKFVALGTTFFSGLFLAALGGYGYTRWLFPEPLEIGRFALLNLLLFLELLVYVALTLLASTLARSQAAAAGLAAAFFALLLIPGAFPQIGRYLPGELASWGIRLLLAGSEEPAWSALGISLGLVALALLGAWADLRRQEI
ncbi:MAG: ABC transporter permease [Chloroflexia bacterium]